MRLEETQSPVPAVIALLAILAAVALLVNALACGSVLAMPSTLSELTPPPGTADSGDEDRRSQEFHATTQKIRAAGGRTSPCGKLAA